MIVQTHFRTVVFVRKRRASTYQGPSTFQRGSEQAWLRTSSGQAEEPPIYATNLRHSQYRLPDLRAPLLVGRNKADHAHQQRPAFSYRIHG
jgi:hypothetical protein